MIFTCFSDNIFRKVSESKNQNIPQNQQNPHLKVWRCSDVWRKKREIYPKKNRSEIYRKQHEIYPKNLPQNSIVLNSILLNSNVEPTFETSQNNGS